MCTHINDSVTSIERELPTETTTLTSARWTQLKAIYQYLSRRVRFDSTSVRTVDRDRSWFNRQSYVACTFDHLAESNFGLVLLEYEATEEFSTRWVAIGQLYDSSWTGVSLFFICHSNAVIKWSIPDAWCRLAVSHRYRLFDGSRNYVIKSAYADWQSYLQWLWFDENDAKYIFCLFCYQKLCSALISIEGLSSRW